MNRKAINQIILNILESQRFNDWYEGKFGNYLMDGQIAKEEILHDIQLMIERNDG